MNGLKAEIVGFPTLSSMTPTVVVLLRVAAEGSYVPQSDPDPARLPEGVVHRVSRLGLPLDFHLRRGLL